MKKALLFFVPIAMLSACSKTEMTIVEEQVGISDVDLKVTRYLTGDAADVTTTTQAGFVLMGGSTDVDAAFEWMIERRHQSRRYRIRERQNGCLPPG